jgi:membrane protein DedA with SNARE-associated domain
MTAISVATALALATLVSEDAATVAAAALVSMRKVDLASALVAVSLGIYVGDLAVFAAGRLARRAPAVRGLIVRRWSEDALAAIASRFERRLPSVVVAGRFLPGSRLPLYLAAGLLSPRARPFVLWTLVAVCLWTPLLMGGTLWLGATFAIATHAYLSWAPVAGLLLAAHVMGRFVTRNASHAPSAAS